MKGLEKHEKECAGTSAKQGKMKEEPKRHKRIRFVEPPKEKKQNSCSESTDKESEKTFLDNPPFQKLGSSESSEESDSISEKVRAPSERLDVSDVNKENPQDKVISIPVHQEVPESLKPPPLKEMSSSSEEEQSSKETSSSPVESDESEDLNKYVKLQEESSKENLHQDLSEPLAKNENDHKEVLIGVESGAKEETAHHEIESPTENPQRKRHRIFEKVPGENAVYVPLHGSSDEEDFNQGKKKEINVCPKNDIHEEAKTGKNLLKRQYAEEPNEYAIFVPLHGGRRSSQEDKENIKAVEAKKDSEPNEIDNELTIENTLIEREEDEYKKGTKKSLKKEKEHKTTFKEIDKNTIIIPLHGSSDETDEADQGESSLKLAGMKKADENIQMECTRQNTPVEVLNEDNQNEKVFTLNKNELEGKQKKLKPKTFIKHPTEKSCIISLHDSSDDDNVDDGSSKSLNIESKASGTVISGTKIGGENNNMAEEISRQNTYIFPENSVTPKDQTTSSINASGTQINNTSKEAAVSGTYLLEQNEANDLPTSVIQKPRLFVKVPNEDAVIIPLHGSTDEEEISINIDEDDGLLERNIHQRKSDSNDEQGKQATSVRKRQVIYEGAPNEYGIIVPLSGNSGEELIDNDTDLVDEQQTTSQKSNNKDSIKELDLMPILIEGALIRKERISLKIPNENIVHVPLHGTSDEEEITGESKVETPRERSESICETPKIQTIQRIYSGSPDENKMYVPLHESPIEKLEITEDIEMQSKETMNLPQERNIGQEEIVTAKEDAVVANERSKQETNKPQLFYKIPNQDAIIIPLHGSSDDENFSLDHDDDGLSISAPSTPIAAKALTKHIEILQASNEDLEEAPSGYGVIVPLHGLPDNLTALVSETSSLISQSEQAVQPIEETESVSDKEGRISEKILSKNKIKKQKMFVKVPNQNAVIIPLHGSSDEEETDELDSIPELREVIQENSERAPNEYDIFVPLHGLPDGAFENTKGDIEATTDNPSILEDNSDNIASIKEQDESPDSGDKENLIREKKHKPPKMFKIPNEDAYFVPLHGSSDEEEKQSMPSYDNTSEPNVVHMEASFSLQERKIEQINEPIIQGGNDYISLKSPILIKQNECTNAKVSDVNKLSSSENSDEVDTLQKKEIKNKKRIFKEISGENAMYIPLHGSSEEESNVMEEKPIRRNESSLSESLPQDKMSSNVQNQEEKEETVIMRGETERDHHIAVHDKEDKHTEIEKTTTGINQESIPIKESRSDKKSKQKKVKSKSSNTPPSETKTGETESIQSATETTKKSATSKFGQLKMADVVLQMVSKKNKEDPAKSSSGSQVEAANSIPPQQGDNECDHEYEPIQAPRAASQPPDLRSHGFETRVHPIEVRTTERDVKPHPVEVRREEVAKQEEEDRYEVVRPQDAPSLQETAPSFQVEGGYEIVEEPEKKEPKRFIRIPNEDAIIIPLHGSSDEEINPDRYENPSLMMSEEEIERHSSSVPKHHPQQDMPAEETKAPEATMQERIRTQADRFTTKLKGISKPNISLHKPNFKLPERPNMKMPDIPKIKLPDRPKFSMPDTSKFHFPERPKFNFPDRSKFHLPDKPKFLTERPKFKLPERPKFSRSEKKPKGPKLKKPNPSSLRRPLRDVVTISSQSTPGSTQNIFETLKFRTYPRFFKKKKAPFVQKMSSLETESSQPSTPPTRARSYSEHQQNTTWAHPYRDVKFADEETNLRVERMEEEYEKEDTAPFHDNYDPNVRSIDDSDLERTKAPSMASVVSEKGSSGSSSVKRRAGVIEEIDSDEFFLREKGLSREDVDVSRYLSLEIRDAFRQPKNALASLDSELYDDEEPEIKFEHVPRAPQRSKPRKSSSFEREQEFNTFPKRPSRRKESDPEIVVKPPRRFRSNSKSGSRYRKRQSSMPSLNSEVDMVAPEAPRRKSRERSIKSLNKEANVPYIDEDSVRNQMSAQHSDEIPPVAPLRKSRSRGTSLADDDRTSRGADSAILPDDDDEVHSTEEAGREDADEEMPMEEEENKEKYVDEEEDGGYKELEPVTIQETLLVKDDKYIDYSGYAVVAKGRKKPPPPRPPPPPPSQQHFHFQSQLDSIKNTGKTIFFTYPRRAIKSLNKQPPTRPVRNYSTLGPVRPPRRNRVFRQPLYMTGDTPGQQESLIDKDRHLKSGDVVMRMKGRPLPAPPRPPRKIKDFDNINESEQIIEAIPTEHIIATTEIDVNVEDLEPELKESRFSYLKSKRDQFFNTLSKYSPLSRDDKEDSVKQEIIQAENEQQTTTSQQTSFDFGEVSVSIQTDPLPKGVVVIDQEIEETEEIFILPTNNRETLEHKEESSIISRDSEAIEEKNIQKERESPEPNIFQHALERVEAARGVLKEARERVTPGSTTSLDKKPIEEKEIQSLKISQSEASKGTLKDERERVIRGSTSSLDKKITQEREIQPMRVRPNETLPTSVRSVEVEKEETPPPLPARPLYTKPIPVSFPDKLHLSELDVDKLNVSEIQANKIKVSEIEGTCVEVTELTSRGGNLTINGIELPPDFISNIVAQVAAQQAHSHPPTPSQQLQHVSRESTPQRQMRRVLTPPPSIFVQATLEQVSHPEPKVPETDVTEHIPQPKATRSKGRKLPTRVIDDSEDELASELIQRRKQEQESKKKSEERREPREDSGVTGPSELCLRQASSVQLMRRLLSIWQENAVHGAGAFAEGVNSLFPEGDKRRDAQVAAIILLVLITGLIIVGYGFDNSVHHHHWDYLPPR